MNISVHRVTKITQSVCHFEQDTMHGAFDRVRIIATGEDGKTVEFNLFMADGAAPQIEQVTED